MVQRRHSEANREVAQLERKALDRDSLSHTIPAPFVLDLEQITRALDDLVASQLRMCVRVCDVLECQSPIVAS